MTIKSIPVLILNYGGWEDTIALVSRLLANHDDIWVIDNGSPIDRSADLIAACPRVNYLPLGHNWGWAGGYNRAIAHVRGTGAVERVYILNNDALPEPDAIANAARHLAEHPEAAAIGSVMLTGDARRAIFDGEFREPYSDAALVDPGLVPAGRIHGGGFALNLRAFDAVGPFHEPYFLYHEESEWCLRAVAAGWSFLIDGASRVLHDGSASDVNQNREYYLARNRYLAFARGFPLQPYETSVDALIDWDFRDTGWRPHLRGIILEAMVDGVAGRFGPRPQQTRSASGMALAVSKLRLRWFAHRAKRKAKRLLGRLA